MMLQLSVLQVDGIYHATLFCYLIPIPAFLLYLFAKQHVALQPTKLLVSFSKETTSEGKELHFARIPSDTDSQLVELKDCPRVQVVMGLSCWFGSIQRCWLGNCGVFRMRCWKGEWWLEQWPIPPCSWETRCRSV